MLSRIVLSVAISCVSLSSYSSEPAKESGAVRIATLFLGEFEGEILVEKPGEKETIKASMRCELIGDDSGARCLLNDEKATSPEYWHMGHNQKNDSYHVFIMTPKSAHDHAAKWVSDNEIDIGPIANNPDGCGVIKMSVKRPDADNIAIVGTEKNKQGEIVKFSAYLKKPLSSNKP